MDWKTVLQNPFFTVALPIVITLVVAAATQNKRFDDLNKRIDDLRADMNRQFDKVNKRFDEVNKLLDRIGVKLTEHGERIAKFEGPTLVRRT